MNRLITLLIDMDSVIVNLTGKWLARYNADYGDQLTSADLHTWDTEKIVKPECGIRIFDYLHEPGFYADLLPLPGALETLERLNRRFDLAIVTSSPQQAFADKDRWVEQHLPFIGRERIIYAHQKHRICGDVLFDDAPHNLTAFRNTGRMAVAMDYLYNRGIDVPRVSGWAEFEQLMLQTWKDA